jgi:hypothetical protein
LWSPCRRSTAGGGEARWRRRRRSAGGDRHDLRSGALRERGGLGGSVEEGDAERRGLWHAGEGDLGGGEVLGLRDAEERDFSRAHLVQQYISRLYFFR